METTGHDPSRAQPTSATPDTADGAATLAAGEAGDRQLGPHAAQLLGTEHWSLIAARSQRSRETCGMPAGRPQCNRRRLTAGSG